MNVRILVRTLLAIVLLISLLAPFATAQDQPPVEKPREPDEALGPGYSPLAVGGPDAFGYTYRDSAQPDGPAYSWVEISYSGTSIPFDYDSTHGPYPIGFLFNFYGSDYSELWASSEGWVSFLPALTDFSNDCPLPNPNGQEGFIAPFWDDRGPSGGPYGSGYYQSFAAGDCPYPTYDGACMVVEWWDVPLWGNAADTQTFEAILLDNHNILVQIQDAGLEKGTSATTGIENTDASDGLTYGCNTAGYLQDGRALMFYYPGPGLTASRKTATAAVELGDPIDYAIEIVNTGNQPAANAVLTDLLPEGTTFIPGSLACSTGTCSYQAGNRTVRWSGEVARSSLDGSRPTPGTLLTDTPLRGEVPAPVTDLSGVPHQIMPAAAPPGTVIETFANAWDIGAEGLVYDPSRGLVRYAHEVFNTAAIWDVDYAPPHSVQGSILLSAVNPVWPAGLDRRNGAAYDPTSDTYFMPDYQGDLASADDNIVEIAPDGTILNAWEMDDFVGSNDSYDGSAVDEIIDIAVVPGTPTRYFVTALDGGNNVYEIDLIKTGSWWTPATWGKVMTCTLSGLADNVGIDYDVEHGLLYHSDWSSTAIVVTDLDCHVLDTFTCASPANRNTGVTYIEGQSEPEIWVTDDSSNQTTRCAASSTPACDRTDTLFSDDFEAGLSNWTLTGLWHEEHEADTCGSLVAPFPSSDTGAYFGRDGACNYDTGARVTGTLELDLDLDLSSYNHAMLTFWSYEETECGGFCTYDRRYVDVSTDGGDTWATVWTSTGPEDAWYQATANLLDYSGGPLRIRFRFDSIDDEYNSHFGWLVDDVEVVACPLPVQLSFAVEAPDWCGPVVNEATITDPETDAVIAQATTYVVEDLYQLWDFEIDGGGFTRGLPGEWEWGTPTYPPGIDAHSGRYVWGTDLHGDADDTIGHHRLSRSVSLPTHPNGVYLSWWDWYGAEGSDCTNVYVDGTQVYGQCDRNQRQWTRHEVNLSTWAGQTVDLEFDLAVCCVAPGPDGWYIDDVAIHSGCIADIDVDAPPLEVSLCTDEVRTLQVSICNNDNLPLEWYLWEMDSTLADGAMGSPTIAEPSIAGVPDLERPLSEELPTNLEVAKALQPTSSHYEGSNPSALDILVCSDSCQVSPPNTCPEVALQNLAESYDLYFQDWNGCETAIESGAYDMVLVDNACFGLAESLFTALDSFLLGGGRVFVNTYVMDNFPLHPFWDRAGVSFVSDVVMSPPPPIYGWVPGHPAIANWPSDPLQFDDLYVDDGDKFDALPSSLPLAGYTAAPSAGEGGLALRYDNRALVSGFCIDNLANRDDDSDSVSDCVEVWQAGLNWLLNPGPGIPWLSEDATAGRVLPGECMDVRVTFDAAGLPIDDYTAELLVRNNDLDTPAIHLPVTMHVTCAAHIYLPIITKD